MSPDDNNPLFELAHDPVPVDTAGDLIEVLKDLPPKTPVATGFGYPLEVVCTNYGVEDGIFLGFIAIRERDDNDDD